MKLILNNSTSQLTGMTTEVYNKLRKILSYQADPRAVYRKAGFTRPTYLIDKKGVFATGNVSRVLDFTLLNNLPVEIQDLRVKPTRKVNHQFAIGLKPYPSQLAAVDAFVRDQRGTISMPTGSGKSLVLALIVARLSVKTLIVVPNLEIKKQLQATFEELFADMSNITIENIDSNALNASVSYDLLLIDEAHRVAAATYQRLNKKNWQGIFFRGFVTATPFRNQKEETLLFEGIAGDVIYQLSYKDAVKEGYIVPVEAYYLDLPKVETDAHTWAQVYSELVVRHDERNMIIGALLGRLKDKSTLCLVKEVAHGQAIADMTGFPFVHGQDDDSRQYIQDFNSGKIKVLIGTEGILGEGVDTKPCEFVVIAGLGKAKSAFMQKCGRSVRRYKDKESAKIILFRDKSHKFTLRHYKEQCTILLTEYGIKPTKLEL